jgi:hypothetical protein
VNDLEQAVLQAVNGMMTSADEHPEWTRGACLIAGLWQGLMLTDYIDSAALRQALEVVIGAATGINPETLEAKAREPFAASGWTRR